MKELTARARANVERGATRGAGTNICAACGSEKAPSRLNSSSCGTCADESRSRRAVTHALKVSIPTDVLAALTDEAARHDQTAAERVTFLLTRKYRR